MFYDNLSDLLDKPTMDEYNVIESATKPENRDDVTETPSRVVRKGVGFRAFLFFKGGAEVKMPDRKVLQPKGGILLQVYQTCFSGNIFRQNNLASFRLCADVGIVHLIPNGSHQHICHLNEVALFRVRRLNITDRLLKVGIFLVQSVIENGA